jgi:hypothetical protein
MTEYVKKQIKHITLDDIRDTAEVSVLVVIFVACTLGTMATV